MEALVVLIIVIGLAALTGPVALALQLLRRTESSEQVNALDLRIRALETKLRNDDARSSASQPSFAANHQLTPGGAMGAPGAAHSAAVARAAPDHQSMAVAASSAAPERLRAMHDSASASVVPAVIEPTTQRSDASSLAPVLASTAAPSVQPSASEVAAARARAAQPAVPRAPSSAEVLATSLLKLISKNPFASAGVILLLIGVGFLFALLASRNILPPVVRVGLVAAGGLGVFLFGIRAEGKRSALAFNLQGLGIAVEFLSALWAYDEYHLITAPQAFMVLGVISLLAYVWAAIRKNIGHAFIGLIGALATPVLTSTGQGTLSSLVIYGLWIALLSIGCGALLGSTMLATVAAAGVFILLELARASRAGDLQMIVAGCVAISLLYTFSALFWCVKNVKMADFERASVILQLIAPPLLMSQFIVASGNVAVADAALLPGFTAAVLLLAAWRIDSAWRVWLLAVASVLGFVGIALHFEGGSQAVSFSAGAMALVLLSQAVRSRMLTTLALLYWIASVVVGIDQLQSHHTLPLDVSTVVALAAAFLQRKSAVSFVYLVVAPLLAGAATLDRLDTTAPYLLWFMLAWTVVSLLVSRLVRWTQLAFSAAWIIPAGAALLFSSDLMGPGSHWSAREVSLLAWFAASAAFLWSVRTFLPQDERRVINQTTYVVWLSALLPVCVSVEVIHVFSTVLNTQDTLVPAALALVWAAAALGSRVHPASLARDQLTMGSLGLALLFAAGAAILTPLQLAHELVLVAAVGLALGVRRSSGLVSTCVNAMSEAIVVVMLAAGLALQLLGERAHAGYSAFQLLFETDMQSFVSLLWALSGLVVVVIGSTQKKRTWWIAGGIALLVLIAKMFVVDLASLTLPAKVGTFMLVGVLFIALGFFCPLPPSRSAKAGSEGLGEMKGDTEPLVAGS